jgi:predicted transposase/invertase (TIGR01784 family)
MPMESDSFFYQLFQNLPQTLFELLGLPASRAKAYRFDSVELKKSFRIDGLFVPKRRSLPLYFVEVQFQRRPNYYADLFAKVFTYLNENDPRQEWVAVAIFPSRGEEPKHQGPYEDLLRSKRVKRIYLDDIKDAKNPPVGLGLVQLLFASESKSQQLAPRIVEQAKADLDDSDLQAKVVELVERALMSRFPGVGVEDIRMKFKLHDIRKSKAWQELREEGHKEGIKEGEDRRLRQTIKTLRAKRKTLDEIADLLDIPVNELQRVIDNKSN